MYCRNSDEKDKNKQARINCNGSNRLDVVLAGYDIPEMGFHNGAAKGRVKCYSFGYRYITYINPDAETIYEWTADILTIYGNVAFLWPE
jgi:hypothetical protein